MVVKHLLTGMILEVRIARSASDVRIWQVHAILVALPFDPTGDFHIP